MHVNGVLGRYYINDWTGRWVDCYRWWSFTSGQKLKSFQRWLFSSGMVLFFILQSPPVLYSINYSEIMDWKKWSNRLAIGITRISPTIFLLSVSRRINRIRRLCLAKLNIKRRMTTAIRTVSQEILNKVWISLKIRLYAAGPDSWSHVEHQWNSITTVLLSVNPSQSMVSYCFAHEIYKSFKCSIQLWTTCMVFVWLNHFDLWQRKVFNQNLWLKEPLFVF